MQLAREWWCSYVQGENEAGGVCALHGYLKKEQAEYNPNDYPIEVFKVREVLPDTITISREELEDAISESYDGARGNYKFSSEMLLSRLFASHAEGRKE